MSKLAATIVMIATSAAADTLPRPPPQIADMARSLGGTWHCDGTAGKDKVKLTRTTRVELGGFWVHDTLAGGTWKLESFTTFYASDGKWHRVVLLGDGSQMIGTAEPMKDLKMEFTLDASGPTGGGERREHLDASDLRRGLHAWGEASSDKGKTWQPAYDLLCRR
jgi:hypothetical protein